MKHRIVVAVLLAMLLPLTAHAGRKGPPDSVNVQVREAIVRSSPNYLGAQVARVPYGTSLPVAQEQGNWYRIAKPAGWIPKSAVTTKRVALDAEKKGQAHGAKRDEVALAGKGFNPQVEAKYKQQNANLVAAYAQVDRVERKTVSEAQLRAFQQAGRLTPR